ncbi:unnamed protein product [Schistocephalus solidus]|uniref:WAC domain-containing protein n=1 Tax=Schistocephalus solidus TaxID=70667 RepID=A0A183SGE4_SCHSO|nr:unnamed protein product [Schistocephalus solidus]
MPLLNGEPFVKKPLSPHMNPDDEVFFSPITFEIFQDYDEFFERTILLNSATWNCSFCNKPQLTYNEAVSCEKSDLAQLNNFGVALCRGLLYIIFQAKRRKLSELVDLLHGFVHYRFFIGESVFVKRSDFKTATNQCVVVERVLPPPGRDCKKVAELSPINASECTNTAADLPDPSAIKYVVKRSTAAGPDGCSVSENSSSMILSGSVLQRGPKNFLTRDKIKFFIRQTCELQFSVFKPKVGTLFYVGFLSKPKMLRIDTPPSKSLPSHQSAQPGNTIGNNDCMSKPKMLRIDTPPPKSLPSHQSAQPGNAIGNNDCSNTSSGEGGGGSSLKKVAFSARVPSSQQQQPKIVVDLGRVQSFEDNQAQAARAARLAALDADRLLRMERADLERDWALLRKRDDLELSDLIPLPDFTEINTRLPVEEFGRAIQILEFLNIYGPMLKLPMPGFQNNCLASAPELVTGSPCIPDAYTSPCLLDGSTNKMTWSLLEDMLFDSDPTGAFTDCLMALLSALRTLENESGARQSSPTAEAAAASAVSAIATLEAGLPLAYAGCLTGLGSSAEYTTMFADTLLADKGALIPAFATAAVATRDCELVGVPPLSAISTRADKAAMALAAATAVANSTSDLTALGLPQTDSTTGGPAICGKSSAVRAAATAAAVGAASLPPLDRAGLSEALWLHIATAPAKAGGWRGAIWGGTRPLDDPCIALMRDYPELVQKLRSVPVFSWPPNEKLLILAVLMDELLLQPQLRDRMEENLEKLRGLRLQLRSIQAERFKLYGGSASIAATLYGFSPSALVSSGDNWLTGTPPILRAQLARGRRKPTAGTSDAAKPASKSVNLVTADVKGSSSNLPADTKSDPACPNGAEVPSVDARSSNNEIKHPLSSFGEELDLEESELWQTMLSVACSCSMIPLGQDRIYRQHNREKNRIFLQFKVLFPFVCTLFHPPYSRYWLVLSLPALLVENTAGEMTEIPGFPTAARNVCLRPSLRVRGRQVAKSLTLGSSPAEAAEALNSAVKTLLATPMEDLQWQNPGLLDRDSLVSQLAIDLPTNREQLSLEQLRILVHPVSHLRSFSFSPISASPTDAVFANFFYFQERRGSITVDANHPAVLQVEKLQTNCPGWAVLLPVPAGKSQPHASIKPEAEGGHSASTVEPSYADRYERATAAVTQLEASLNPRGQREGRLRKSVSQLRPLLIQAVADCPAELLTGRPSQYFAEVGRTPAGRPNWEDVLFSWLECTIHGVGMRLGLDCSLIQDLLKPLPRSLLDTEHKNDHEDATENSSSVFQGDENATDASHSRKYLEVPAVSTTSLKNSLSSRHQPTAETTPTVDLLPTPTLLRSVLTGRLDQRVEGVTSITSTVADAIIIPPALGDRLKVSPSPLTPLQNVQSQQPKESATVDLNPSSSAGQTFSDRLRRLADIVTSLGLALGPRRLAGPLSNDERSIRGLQASKSASNLLAVNGAAEDSSSSQHPQHCDSPAPASCDAEDLGLVPGLPVQTTGWQRWLSSVASTTSISQLHLLTRALERAARRAVRGGRGVPAAIFSYASQIPLPEVRCTACGGPPDSNPTPARGPNCILTGAFSVCSACACPFHLDCLLCSRARTPSSRNFRSRVGTRVSAQLTRASELSALPLARHLASPYTLLGTLLGSAPATRLELTGLCLLLCDRCRRLAGYPVSETFVEASATCITPPAPMIGDVETVASTDPAAVAPAASPLDMPDVSAMAEGGGAPEATRATTLLAPPRTCARTNLEYDRLVQHLSISSLSHPPCSDGKTISTHLELGSGSHAVRTKPPVYAYHTLGGVEFASGHRLIYLDHVHDISFIALRIADIKSLESRITISPRRTIQSAVHENGPLAASFSSPRGRQKRGRPPSSSSPATGRGRSRGRPPKRSRFHLEEANHAEHDDRGRGEATEEEEDLEAGLESQNGSDVGRRDPADCVHYDDEEDAFLQHRVGSSHPVTCSPHINGGLPKSAKPAVGRRRSGVATSTYVQEPSGTCASEFGLNHQAAAERFLAEISSLSVARPLIRCALGRTVLLEERNSGLWPAPQQTPTVDGFYRTRRTTQGCGAAVDNCSLGVSNLYAYDLDGLTDLLSRKALPRGPGEVVSQLR